MTYVVLMLFGNIVFMNFLIAVVNQSYEACMQRMQSQTLKAQLYLIRDYYLYLSKEDFDDKSMFKESYIHPKD
jgi:succinate dehydrogenase hydrophobic anchor subunit